MRLSTFGFAVAVVYVSYCRGARALDDPTASLFLSADGLYGWAASSNTLEPRQSEGSKEPARNNHSFHVAAGYSVRAHAPRGGAGAHFVPGVSFGLFGGIYRRIDWGTFNEVGIQVEPRFTSRCFLRFRAGGLIGHSESDDDQSEVVTGIMAGAHIGCRLNLFERGGGGGAVEVGENRAFLDVLAGVSTRNPTSWSDSSGVHYLQGVASPSFEVGLRFVIDHFVDLK